MSQGNHHHSINPLHALQSLLSGGTLSSNDMEEMAQNVMVNAQTLNSGFAASAFSPGVVPPGLSPLFPLASHPTPAVFGGSALSPPPLTDSKKKHPKESQEDTSASASVLGATIAGEGSALPFQAVAAKKRPHPETQEAASLDKKQAPDSKNDPPVPKVQIDETAWNAVLKRIPRCGAGEGIRETSFFKTKFAPGGAALSGCLRQLLQELSSLEDSLPTNPAIWLRFDEETPQFLRALITAPTGTPYALGLFCFDVFVPDTYPKTPPIVQLLTTGGGTVAFSPNLYSNGKVCLSLLNTWHGPGWNPRHSTLLQVLVSIQGLILGVEHPYYLEPGHGGWEGEIKQGGVHAVPTHVKQYEDRIRKGTLQFAMLEMLGPTTTRRRRRPQYLDPFGDAITWHFFHCKDIIRQEIATWASYDIDVRTKMRSHATRMLQNVVDQVKEALMQLEAPEDGDTKQDNDTSKSFHADCDNDKKEAASTRDDLESVVAAKRTAMNDAASREDYITAGRLQSEMKHLETAGVDLKIAMKRSEMEEAAKNGDYISAGQLQSVVRHLEKSKKRLQELERCIFEAASKQDFVRAGRLQEQYRILQDCSENTNGSPPAHLPMAAAAAMGSWPPTTAASLFSSTGHIYPPAFSFGYVPPVQFGSTPASPPPAYAEFEPKFEPEFSDDPGDYDEY